MGCLDFQGIKLVLCTTNYTLRILALQILATYLEEDLYIPALEGPMFPNIPLEHTPAIPKPQMKGNPS